MTIPLGRPLPGASRDLPERRRGSSPGPRKPPRGDSRTHRSYSVLLPVGFTVPSPSPGARCALTAPFHPCRRSAKRTPAVCFLWHFPWGCPRRALPGTVFPWSPDFPPPKAYALKGGHPAVWLGPQCRMTRSLVNADRGRSATCGEGRPASRMSPYRRCHRCDLAGNDAETP